MKLIRYGAPGMEKPGIFREGNYYDVSKFFRDYDEAFFEGGGLELLGELDKEGALKQIMVERLGCPIKRPSKIVCIGLNYSDHAKETGATPPSEPVIFLKSTTAIIGPNDAVRIPRGAEKTDWEVELAVVIGKKASYIEKDKAMDYVAGYCLHNDISERAFQLEMGGTWDKGKGCDTFAPIGPWLVTKDEIDDVHSLRLWLKLNGHLMQNGSTSNLIFDIPALVAYTSCFMTLLPGDIISTGTPAGVGLGMKPNLYLKAGDIMELGIDGLGESRQELVAFDQI
ncbi:MAG: fumarylacetoacetate hydrolase family protein [Chitinophagaceae bacterium]|nr:fumarylacetoacetate hydrolase family protein [Chitinophagaceae bacterium]